MHSDKEVAVCDIPHDNRYGIWKRIYGRVQWTLPAKVILNKQTDRQTNKCKIFETNYVTHHGNDFCERERLIWNSIQKEWYCNTNYLIIILHKGQVMKHRLRLNYKRHLL